MFLKKTYVEGCDANQFLPGCKFHLCSRHFEVIDYLDAYTSAFFADLRKGVESTLAIIKPNAYDHIGEILCMIQVRGFRLIAMKMIRWARQDAVEFYREHAHKSFFEDLIAFMTSDVIAVIHLEGCAAIALWRSLIGPTDSDRARRESPKSIRALYGIDSTRNAVHGSDSPASASREISLVFRGKTTTAVLNYCTLVIIKPHVLQEHAGDILSAFQKHGLEISAIQIFDMKLIDIQDFLEAYRGIITHLDESCREMASGPFLAMEIRGEDIVKIVKEIVGPMDPLMAKQLRPSSLRALYGVDFVRNAIHCSDTQEEGVRECKYMFGNLSR